MSHQDGFGNNRSEPSWSDDNDGMQKKSENVAHAEDGIRLKKLKNSGNLELVEFATYRGHKIASPSEKSVGMSNEER